MAQSIEQIIIQLRVESKNAVQKLRQQQKVVNKTGMINRNFEKSLDKVSIAQGRLAKATKLTQKPFAGWALSIMFAGMALKRAFDVIWRSSQKVFQDVSHSVEGTVTSFDMLSGSMKFLQFSAGQALEPIAAKLVPIIDRVSEWIQENEKLFKGIVIALGVSGTVLTAIGMTKLAIDGLIQAFAFFKIAALGIVAISWSTILTNMKKLVTVAKSLLLLGWTGFVKNLKWIKMNPIKSIFGGAVLAGIILVVAWIIKAKNEMGGWKEFGKNVFRGLLNLLAMFAAAISAIAIKIKDLFSKDFSAPNFKEVYTQALLENQRTILQDLGAPEQGFTQNRSISQIIQADLYPELNVTVEVDGEEISSRVTAQVQQGINETGI